MLHKLSLLKKPVLHISAKMTLLFTGHQGFLGRELIPDLQMHEEVVHFQGDCADYSALQKFVKDFRVDKVIHAAARGGRRTKTDSVTTLLNNVESTVNILRLELPSVLICSGAIYNRAKPISQAKEKESLSSYPSDFYGQSKFIGTAFARKQNNYSILRFFNVFGVSEGIDRFITFNILQYIKHKPMVIFKDFQMDFFYVRDVIPLLVDWLGDTTQLSEINMVYRSKLLLSEICEKINSLSDYRVPVQVESFSQSNNYTGDGELLHSFRLNQLGLDTGISDMYNFFLRKST
jgi:nucleoside-diphosphate-sugar epimerase